MSSTFISNLSDDELRAHLNKNNIIAGPIGPSTRRVYEMKLQKILDATENVQMNGNSTESPTKEHVPETNGESFFGLVEKMPDKSFNNISRRSIVFEEEPHTESPRKKDGEESDAHSEFEESVRILTPEEVVRFRSSFSSNPNLRKFADEDTYEKPVATNSANKVSIAKTLFSGVAMFILIGFSVALIIKINWESLTDPSEKDEV